MRIEDLSAGYHGKAVVNGVSIDIEKGEIISLIGPNGGGKSTLLKSIFGELKPIHGAVFIEKENIRTISLKELSRKMSIVNTDRVKSEHMSAMDVVMSGRLPYSDGFGLFSDKDSAAAAEVVKLMKIEEFSDKPFMDLSDGQKQRTLIARAICQDPEYLIMDEPTSYLDIRYRMELMEVIRQLSGRGVTVIMSLHELELAIMISDRVLMVGSAGAVSCRKPREILESEVLKDLYVMTDEMYEKVKRQLEVYASDEPQRGSGQEKKHCSFFLNKECEYYPCHDLPEEKFNCLFCYCPLYDIEDCGGNYYVTEKGVKNCKDCTFPHDRDNYGPVIKKLKEKMYGKVDGGQV